MSVDRVSWLFPHPLEQLRPSDKADAAEQEEVLTQALSQSAGSAPLFGRGLVLARHRDGKGYYQTLVSDEPIWADWAYRVEDGAELLLLPDALYECAVHDVPAPDASLGRQVVHHYYRCWKDVYAQKRGAYVQKRAGAHADLDGVYRAWAMEMNTPEKRDAIVAEAVEQLGNDVLTHAAPLPAVAGAVLALAALTLPMYRDVANYSRATLYVVNAINKAVVLGLGKINFTLDECVELHTLYARPVMQELVGHAWVDAFEKQGGVPALYQKKHSDNSALPAAWEASKRAESRAEAIWKRVRARAEERPLSICPEEKKDEEADYDVTMGT